MNETTENNPLALIGSGKWMNGFSADISRLLSECESLCFELNALPPSRQEERTALVRKICGSTGNHFVIHSPFHCDFGSNIHLGEYFVGNFNLTILDEAPVNIGNQVFIGPNCSLCTVIHAFHADQRNEGIMRALPITIGNNVWIAANVVVLPGVTIGEGAVIGAGSVVTKDIPAHSLAAGNPCKVIRTIEDKDRVFVKTE